MHCLLFLPIVTFTAYFTATMKYETSIMANLSINSYYISAQNKYTEGVYAQTSIGGIIF